MRVDADLGARLRRRARAVKVKESALVRAALESYLAKAPEGMSVYDWLLASGSLGCAKGLPADLATNRKYMEGFGESS